MVDSLSKTVYLIKDVTYLSKKNHRNCLVMTESVYVYHFTGIL